MEKSTTYFKDGNKFETLKDRKGVLTRILVKRNGSPYEIIIQDRSKMQTIKHIKRIGWNG
jgi:hypothetical protein